MENSKLYSELLFILDGINLSLNSKNNIIQYFKELTNSHEKTSILEKIVDDYKNENSPYFDIVKKFHEFREKYSNIGEFQGNSVILCLFFSRLFNVYLDKKMDEKLFWDNAKDLSYKIKECELVKGCTGIFVPSWYVDFFRLNTYTFGRLQFERCLANFKYNDIKTSDKCIAVHIPRTGTKLDKIEVDNSINLAYNFFKKEFLNNRVLFTLCSWLLFEENKNFLKSDSNIINFANRFTLVKTFYNDDYSELWRIFDCEFNGLESLHGDSCLRRGYIELVKNNKKIGEGLGYFYRQE